MLEQIQARIAEIEKAMQELVTQHSTLSGHLNEAKFFLDMATKSAEVIAPTSCATECLEVVDKVVDEIPPQ